MIEFDKLVRIVSRLRDRDNGCPWDIKQTSQSLVANFIEELYEAVEAIEYHDYKHLKEELGDLLLHIVMQAQIATEEDNFDIKDVINSISEKLIRRHPHVFDENAAKKDAAAVKQNWELLKQEEKKQTRESILDGIPHSMPALIVAQRIQEKAATVGFDWDNIQLVFDKLSEELEEFKHAYQNKDQQSMYAEMGDVLFSLVNLARVLDLDAESALRATIKKFEQRFKQIERYHKENDIDIRKSSLEMMDEIWNIAKENEV